MKFENFLVPFSLGFLSFTVEILGAHKGSNRIKLFTECNKTDSFLPFGSGSRACVGQKFAILGISMLIASLLLNYEVCCDNCYAYSCYMSGTCPNFLFGICSYGLSIYITCKSIVYLLIHMI
jgi:hypothetical protein